jgi:hypothetical protein
MAAQPTFRAAYRTLIEASDLVAKCVRLFDKFPAYAKQLPWVPAGQVCWMPP